MSLDDVTRELGEAYEHWKSGEHRKNKARDRFFEAATEALKEEIPSQVVETVEASDEEEALRIAQRKFQRHTVVDVEVLDSNKWSVILEENPELKEFSYVNKEDGKVYQRIVAEGSPILDDEGLRDENPELWNEITNEVTERRLKPIADLTPEQAAKIRPYITMPKPTVRLGKPRRAKPEELEIDEDEREIS